MEMVAAQKNLMVLEALKQVKMHRRWTVSVASPLTNDGIYTETMIFIQKLRSIAYTLKGERWILCRFYAVFMLFYTLLCANNDDFYAVFNSIIALTSYSKSSIPTAQV